MGRNSYAVHDVKIFGRQRQMGYLILTNYYIHCGRKTIGLKSGGLPALRAFTFSRTRVFRSIPCFSGIVKRQFDFPEFFSSLLSPILSAERKKNPRARMGRSLPFRSISHTSLTPDLISRFTGVNDIKSCRESWKNITRFVRRNFKLSKGKEFISKIYPPFRISN